MAAPLLAQSNFATFSGSVTHAQARPVSDALIEVRAKATGLLRSIPLNAEGLFEVPACRRANIRWMCAPAVYTV